MPQNKNNPVPPKTMTWGKATIPLALAVIFDLLRAFFNLFWFFGPTLVGVACAVLGADKLGTGAVATAVTTGVCAVGAGTVGYIAAPAFILFGVVMAMAIGLIGWLTIGAVILSTNASIFRENIANTLWFASSLMASEAPLINALPALTSVTFKMYATQIHTEKAARKKWEAEHIPQTAQEVT